MKVLKKIKSLQKTTRNILLDKNTIGFIPTMGALHKGHLALIQKARKENDIVIVSIFINPKQFNKKEDLDRYPHTLARDKKLINAYVDYLLYPDGEEMYPEGFQSAIHMGELANTLEGEHRPGHFDGMATVVLKLLHMCQPTRVYMGLKDYQQYLIVQQMVKDLNIPVQVVGVPTVRAESKLALSSRNQLLTSQNKTSVAQIYAALLKAKKLIHDGEVSARTIETAIKAELKHIPNSKVDYVSVRSLSLETVTTVNQDIVILVAIYLGDVRLIDNIIVRL